MFILTITKVTELFHYIRSGDDYEYQHLISLNTLWKQILIKIGCLPYEE